MIPSKKPESWSLFNDFLPSNLVVEPRIVYLTVSPGSPTQARAQLGSLYGAPSSSGGRLPQNISGRDHNQNILDSSTYKSCMSKPTSSNPE